MALFIEHLLKNRWAIQVMQHALSLLAHVPLRLVDRTEIFQTQPQDLDLEHYASLKTEVFFVTSLPKEVVKYCNNRRYSFWMTRPSNIHPLVESLRGHPKWLAWEHLMVGSWLKGQRGMEVVTRPYFHPAMQMKAYPLEIPDLFDGFLIIGPSFLPPGDGSDATFANKCVDKFVNKVIDISSLFPSAFKFDRDELKLLGTSRGWIKESLIEQKANMLGRVIRSIFNLECDLPPSDNLQRCTYNNLAQISFLLNRCDAESILNELKQIIKYNPKYELELLHRHKDNTELQLILEFTDEKLKLNKVMPENIPIGKKIWIAGIKLLSEENQLLTSKLLFKLEDLWRDLGASYGSLHNGYAKDSLTRFENWLNNEFGLVSAMETEDKNQPSSRNMYWRIARQVTHLFTADTTTFYVYDYPKEALQYRTTYFQEELSAEKRHERREAVQSLMNLAKDQPALREQSISYRCADKREARFCRAWDREDLAQIDPKNEKILNPPEGPELWSAMAVPIVVNRRLFGVMEIGGYNLYQFRFANVRLAQEVANLLGTFLYQKEVLAALNRLSHTILHPEKEDKEKYKDICHEFTTIFAANGAVIYLPQGQRQEKYELIEWWNRPDLDEFSKEEMESCILTLSQPGSALIESFKSTEWCIIKNIKKLVKDDPNWSNRLPQRRALPNLFDWQVAIPVRDPRGVGRTLCGLYVYYKSYVKGEQEQEPLSNRWEPTGKFLVDYVALLMTALQSRREEEEKLQDILSHELKQTVESVSQRAEDMQRSLGDFVNNISSYCRKKELMKTLNAKVRIIYKDMESSQKVLSRIATLLEAESFRKLIYSGLDPISYLIAEMAEIDLKAPVEKINLRDFLYKIWWSMAEKEEYTLKNMKFHFVGPSIGPFIIANKTVVHGIFTNLVVNAAKYSLPRMGIEAKIEETKHSLIIHIINKAKSLGTGEEQSIFEYGFRGSNADNRDVTGKGLGLTVARRLCEFLGGSLKLEITVLDGGKKISRFDFKVVLPLIIVLRGQSVADSEKKNG